MRPLRLELRGFTAFRRPAVVDFSGRTLFAITGPTGAGKSSLLDAMTWALYGQVPRVGRSTHQLVSHGEKAMSVRFDFSARGHTYRVTRTTAGAIGTRLEQRVTGEAERWRLVADRAGEVTKAIGGLVGLDYATFTKTIVLPQGEFGAFLRGEERERRDILSTLLGLSAYEAVGRAARGRAREAQQSAGLLTRQLERLTLGTPEALGALEAEHAALEVRRVTSTTMRASLVTLGTAAEAHTTAARALEEAARAERAAQEACVEAERAFVAAAAETATAHVAHTQLLAERVALGYDAEAHQQLREAAQLVEARESASRALEEARAAEVAAGQQMAAAQDALASTHREATVRQAAADAACEALRGATSALCGAVGTARGLMRALGAAETEAEAAASAAEAETVALARTSEQLEALATEARALEVEQARGEAALVAARSAAAAALEAELCSTRDAEAAAVGVQHARGRAEAARAAHAASALRSGLAPGDPCPVCGHLVAQLPLGAVPDLTAAEGSVAAAEALLREALAAQRTASAGAATAAAQLDALEAEARRRVERKQSLGAALEAIASTCESLAAPALATAAADARARAAAARTTTMESRVRLSNLRDVRHALDLRVTEAAARLGDTALVEDDEAPAAPDLETARRAAHALARAVVMHAAASVTASTAVDAGRVQAELAVRAGEAATRAQRDVEGRATATQAAELQLATLPHVTLAGIAGGDVRTVLEAAEALARSAADLGARAQHAATRSAVLQEREQERSLQRRQRAVEADAAVAVRDERAGTARDTEAAFASLWRELLGATRVPDVGALRQLEAEVEAEARALAQALGALEARLERARHEAAESAQLRTEVHAAEATSRTAGALERELHADRFIAYVQREALAVLAADASSRLLHLTGGRYRLVGEADEFYVIDHLNGEERRSVRTLSGGETFLASLALALALSERLPELAGAGGALSLESLFLDEGFGSLDAASLDVAIEGLERLAGGRRLIGVISHVPEIAERLPDRIDVLKAPEGSSIAAG